MLLLPIATATARNTNTTLPFIVEMLLLLLEAPISCCDAAPI